MIITKSEPFTSDETKMLIGSLSNDLFRVASLAQRGSQQAAQRFLKEAKRWASELKKHDLAHYISAIIDDILSQEEESISIETAEKDLMYGVLLQNYALKRM
jgi:hypothetical protein